MKSKAKLEIKIMNYPQSQEILEEINKAKRILVNLHRGPDPDSFACAFSLYYFLCSLGKEVDVVLTNTSRLSSPLMVQEESGSVKKVNFLKLDFNKYDLFISPDSGSWQQIVDNPDVRIPNIPIVIIDHHDSNDKFGKINLVDADAASCSQVVYLLFKDWNFFVDTKMANLLLMGIIGDTGGFAFSNDPKAFSVASELMELGADKVKIINEMYRTKTFKEVMAWGEYLNRMELDSEHKFVWAAISNEDYMKHDIPAKVGSMVASQFLSIVEGTNFGIAMTEHKKESMHISFVSRSYIDVAKLGEEFGGGGHEMAAGGILEGLPFERAVEKVLETARKYAKDNKS